MPPRKKHYSAYCLTCGVGHNKAFGYCLVPNCDGKMGTEGQLIKKEREKCFHLITDNLIMFKYCPKCGQKLKEKANASERID